MSGQLSRRKFTLEPQHGEPTTKNLELNDIEVFLEENADHNPELVSVTFEVTDPISDCSTTN